MARQCSERRAPLGTPALFAISERNLVSVADNQSLSGSGVSALALHATPERHQPERVNLRAHLLDVVGLEVRHPTGTATRWAVRRPADSGDHPHTGLHAAAQRGRLPPRHSTPSNEGAAGEHRRTATPMVVCFAAAGKKFEASPVTPMGRGFRQSLTIPGTNRASAAAPVTVGAVGDLRLSRLSIPETLGRSHRYPDAGGTQPGAVPPAARATGVTLSPGLRFHHRK